MAGLAQRCWCPRLRFRQIRDTFTSVTGGDLYRKLQGQTNQSKKEAHRKQVDEWLFNEGAYEGSDTSVRLWQKYYNLLEKCIKCQEYNIGNGYGDGKFAIIKALDFSDEITTGMRAYNICRAKLVDGSPCGLALSSKMWFHDIEGPSTITSQAIRGYRRTGTMRTRGKWGCKCMCEWGYLVKETYIQ